MQTIKKLLFLLTPHERKRAGLLLLMILIMALLDMIGVASILPFIAVLTNPDIIETNAILDELESFANSIINKEKPIVDFNDGYLALHTAQRIIESY